MTKTTASTMRHLISTLILATSFEAIVGQYQFCPLEKDGNRCRSVSNQYKCGVFFINLQGYPDPLAWIGGLPDVLAKKAVRDSAELRASFGNVERKDFVLRSDQCGNVLANARCFAVMTKLKDVPLDGCERNIINENGSDTIGNVLCDRINRFLPGIDRITDATVGFAHSVCGSDWQTTGQGSNPLLVSEKLCCARDGGPGSPLTFYRCNGAPYSKVCVKN